MLHKVFSILESIAFKKARTIDAISKETGISRSTVHRLLQALRNEEIVNHSGKNGYFLTPRLLSIGMSGMAERDVLDIAIPVMRQLSETTRETISLNVLSGYERVCVYRIEGNYPITRNIPIGSTGPLFKGSAGKVVASGLNPTERERVLARYAAAGEIAESDIPKLLEDAEKAKKEGYALSVGERVKGSASIAVPISDLMGKVVASLSLSSLENRFTVKNQKKYIDLLTEAARQIQQSLGIVEQ
jgi:DNA-binding IclR family transcriptional regulator